MMKKRHRVKAIAAAAVCLSALLLSGCSVFGGSDKSSSVAYSHASKLPSVKSFQAGLISGLSISESDLSSVDVTVINIWQTTCQPCIREMPDLALFEEALPDNVQLYTWCLDGRENKDRAKQILNGVGFRGKTIIEWDGDLNTLLGQISFTPTTIFLDSQGNIAAEEIIGAGDVFDKYTQRINDALRAMGKDEIKL